MHRLPVPRLLAILSILAICLGASASSCSLGGKDDPNSPDFVTELQLQDDAGLITDTFEQGESITLVLTVRNRLNSTATVEFSDARTYDFVVVNENSSTVRWKWSTANGPSATQPALPLEFAPYETKTFTFTWDQRDDAGVQLARGDYEARGVLVYSTFDSRPLETNQLGSTLSRFTIR